MPDWVIWVIIASVLMGCGSGCKYGMRRHRGLPHERRRQGTLEGREEAPGSRPALAGQAGGLETAAARPPRQREPAAVRRETPLEALQRRFVDGALTLEQYEAEIDRLERLE